MFTGLLLAIEVAIALWVRDRWIRPYGGDVLAVMLVYCALRAVTAWRWPTALAAAMVVAIGVELGQLAGLLSLLGLRATSAAGVVLGSGFDLLDFAAYALGGVVVAVVERVRAR